MIVSWSEVKPLAVRFLNLMERAVVAAEAYVQECERKGKQP